MRNKIIIAGIVLTILFMSSSLVFAEKIILEEDRDIDGIKYKQGTVVELMWEKPKMGTLAEDQEIQGVVYAKGTKIEFSWNKVSKGVLAENQRIDGVLLSKGTIVEFDSEGHIKKGFLFANQVVDGIKCAKDTTVELEVQKLKKGTLSANQVIQGIKCAQKTDVLFSSGKILEATLSDPQDFETGGYPKGTRILWNPVGEYFIREVFLPEDHKIYGILFSKEHSVRFFAPRILWMGALAKGQNVQGVDILSVQEVEFFPSGIVKAISLDAPQTVGNLECKGDILFYNTGAIERVELSEEQIIQNIRFSVPEDPLPGPILSFFQTGNIKSVFSDFDVVLNGIKFQGQKRVLDIVRPGVVFDNSGNFYGNLAQEAYIRGKTFLRGATIGINREGRFIGDLNVN